jgi:hypothetical protein
MPRIITMDSVDPVMYDTDFPLQKFVQPSWVCLTVDVQVCLNSTVFTLTFYNCLGEVFIYYCFVLHGTTCDQVIISQFSLLLIKACSFLTEIFIKNTSRWWYIECWTENCIGGHFVWGLPTESMKCVASYCSWKIQNFRIVWVEAN